LVSTDEVYGEAENEARDETAPLLPTNPYAASKAAADMIYLGYLRSFGLPAVIMRSNNIFGIRQFPEKLIPKCIVSMIARMKIPIHGTGEYRRHYLSVDDFVDALIVLIERGELGEIYNVASNEEFTNLNVAQMVVSQFGNIKDPFEHVPDRRFNDRRYLISCEKLKKLGWQPRRSLPKELPALVKWYVDNSSIYLKSPHLLKWGPSSGAETLS
jgi:UDP-glucose 4,6-dehydratase